MNLFFRKHPFLAWSALISLSLLFFFALSQWLEWPFLGLDLKWMIVAGIPILIGLFAGGYIKNLKGFGLELEASLKKPMDLSRLTAVKPEVVPQEQKRGLDMLFQKPLSERLLPRRLTFRLGSNVQYVPDVIAEYLQQLPNVEFIECADQQGRFQELFPAALFESIREDGRKEWKDLEKLASALNANAIQEYFPSEAEGQHVPPDLPVIELYKKLKASRYGWLPVVGEDGLMRGVLRRETVTEKIAEQVLRESYLCLVR